MLTDADTAHLRRAFALAGEARARGDRPFAAVIVGADGGTLAHSEMNACQSVIAAGIARETLRGATIYCSGEPCSMCASAIFYTGIGRVVFGLSAAAILHLRNAQPHTAGLRLSCEAVLATAAERVEVVGPSLEAEGAAPHEGYWVPGAA